MAYNYLPTYQPNYYGQQYQPMQPTLPQPSMQTQLPPQQVLQANGRTSINALRMSPNSSVLIMDTTAPVVWLCTSDSLGNVTPVAYDIVPHKEKGTADVGDIEARLSAVEDSVNNILSKWEGVNNGKSNVVGAKSKQAVRNGNADGPD